ncbi:unnamed protein product [Prorocentrum cordatum]|uniref:RING-type domain-containing protein n=1 Tax=Prorocentrum cordatum TaxID=2364126 RepID=A0ABN9U6W0_9DINO|nr:unnamed protein product [Polarella glacialis]
MTSDAGEYLAQQYRDFELPPGYSESPQRCEAALAELLASAPGCSGESRVRPYNKELVSWPKHVAPVPTADLVSEADRSMLLGWRHQMLRDPADAAALRKDSGLGSPYVVPRLRFRPREYADFLLRLDQAGMLEWDVADRRATFFIGFFFVEKSNGGSVLVDGAAVPPLRKDSDVIGAGYVDNFATVSLDPEVATSACQAMRDVLVSRGLPVDEFAPAAKRVVFIGLDILGDVGVVRCKIDRLCRLRQALFGLLRRGFASPLALSAVVGHCAWGMITNRPMLSVFNSVYRFMGLGSRVGAPLWPSVIAELRAAAALLPLWWADVRAQWSATTCCSDAPPYGIGVCRKTVDREVAAAAGRLSERWRYRFSDAVHARASATLYADYVPCRTRSHPGPVLIARGALSVLESAAASDTTMANYWDAAKKFEEWCRSTPQTFAATEEVGVILATYFVNRFLDGFGSATGRVLMPALKHYLPAILAGSDPCPRAARALTAAMASVVGVLIAWKLFDATLFIGLMFDAYLRPSEAHRLTVRSVIRPRPVHDEGPTDDLWALSPDAVRGMFRRAAAALGLEIEFILYSLRHGGASDDLLSLRRTTNEVKDGGHWMTGQIPLCFVKRARMQQRIVNLGQTVVKFNEQVDWQKNDLILLTAASSVFPRQVPLAVTPTPPAAGVSSAAAPLACGGLAQRVTVSPPPAPSWPHAAGPSAAHGALGGAPRGSCAAPGSPCGALGAVPSPPGARQLPATAHPRHAGAPRQSSPASPVGARPALEPAMFAAGLQSVAAECRQRDILAWHGAVDEASSHVAAAVVAQCRRAADLGSFGYNVAIAELMRGHPLLDRFMGQALDSADDPVLRGCAFSMRPEMLQAPNHVQFGLSILCGAVAPGVVASLGAEGLEVDTVHGRSRCNFGAPPLLRIRWRSGADPEEAAGAAAPETARRGALAAVLRRQAAAARRRCAAAWEAALGEAVGDVVRVVKALCEQVAGRGGFECEVDVSPAVLEHSLCRKFDGHTVHSVADDDVVLGYLFSLLPEAAGAHSHAQLHPGLLLDPVSERARVALARDGISAEVFNRSCLHLSWPPPGGASPMAVASAEVWPAPPPASPHASPAFGAEPTDPAPFDSTQAWPAAAGPAAAAPPPQDEPAAPEAESTPPPSGRAGAPAEALSPAPPRMPPRPRRAHRPPLPGRTPAERAGAAATEPPAGAAAQGPAAAGSVPAAAPQLPPPRVQPDWPLEAELSPVAEAAELPSWLLLSPSPLALPPPPPPPPARQADLSPARASARTPAPAWSAVLPHLPPPPAGSSPMAPRPSLAGPPPSPSDPSPRAALWEPPGLAPVAAQGVAAIAAAGAAGLRGGAVVHAPDAVYAPDAAAHVWMPALRLDTGHARELPGAAHAAWHAEAALPPSDHASGGGGHPARAEAVGGAQAAVALGLGAAAGATEVPAAPLCPGGAASAGRRAPGNVIMQCGICHDDGPMESLASCGHLVCSDCLERALGPQRKCPFCRCQVSGSQPLFAP